MELQGSKVSRDPRLEDLNILQGLGSRDLNFPEYERPLEGPPSLARESSPFFSLVFLSSLSARSRRRVERRSRYLPEVYRDARPFFRNKYVSLGKQEAISASLADQAIPAIPWTLPRWLSSRATGAALTDLSWNPFQNLTRDYPHRRFIPT